jgi:GntR family transcriptional regulator/MocR family aminotransferase
VDQQNALASLLESGFYETNVRRVRRLNRERREALLKALRHRFADGIVIEGADAGLHVIVWFKELARSLEDALVETARRTGVGVHPISSLYDKDSSDPSADKVGLVMGYAALDTRQIERGVHLLARAVQQVRAGCK